MLPDQRLDRSLLEEPLQAQTVAAWHVPILVFVAFGTGTVLTRVVFAAAQMPGTNPHAAAHIGYLAILE